MIEATLNLHTKFTVGAVDDRIFGGFIEHLGRHIYEGVYEPGHLLANENGLRTDVKEALRELDLTIVRYPGGNFASGYHWQNGVGPRESRPTVQELAWQSKEINHFGTDEFIQLCRDMNWQPMLALNLGTANPEESRNWLEYCNLPGGTQYADQRVANGHAEPYGVTHWCLGNEMDGPWQLGHVPVAEYCSRTQMVAKLMKDCDPSVELVACGSSAPQMDTYLDWDRQVLSRLGTGLANYISLHRYVGNNNGDTADYLGISKSIDQQIEEVDATARHVAGVRKSKIRAYLCFDEWNVWYRARGGEYSNGRGRFAPPLLEEVYNLEDALVVAQFLMSFIRHADVVKIANIAQLVNVIGPIMTRKEGVLRQTIHDAFRMISSRKGGTSLKQAIVCDNYETSFGEVGYLDCASMMYNNELKVFALNRNLAQPMHLTIDCADMSISGLNACEILYHDNLKAENTWDRPNEVRSQAFDSVSIQNGRASLELPRHSFASLSFQID